VIPLAASISQTWEHQDTKPHLQAESTILVLWTYICNGLNLELFPNILVYSICKIQTSHTCMMPRSM
jgi:hypothetical protein